MPSTLSRTYCSISGFQKNQIKEHIWLLGLVICSRITRQGFWCWWLLSSLLTCSPVSLLWDLSASILPDLSHSLILAFTLSCFLFSKKTKPKKAVRPSFYLQPPRIYIYRAKTYAHVLCTRIRHWYMYASAVLHVDFRGFRALQVSRPDYVSRPSTSANKPSEVCENGMSSGRICWRCENVGEFVPFLCKIGEICHFHSPPFSNSFVLPTSFFRFAHLQISPTCRFRVHPLIFSVSPLRRFDLLVDFTYLQISSNCTCLVLWLELSVFAYKSFSPTDSFHPLCQRNQFLRTICALVSPTQTCRFDLLVDFTYWQISYTCTCLVLWLALCVFASTAFSPTDAFHPLCHRYYFSSTILCALVSHTCRFHLLVDFTQF